MSPPAGQRKSAVLLATLGTEPQVITAVYDLLQQRGEQPDTIIIIHSVARDELLVEAVRLLGVEFGGGGYPPELEVVFAPLLDPAGEPLADVETRQAAETGFRTLYRHIRGAKLAGKRVHLSIAGGRKSLSVFGMAAAQLLFDEDDRLWHLYSAGDFLRSRRLHPAAGDEVQLIPIPVILWSWLSPAVLPLADVDDPFAAVAQVRGLQLKEKRERARRFATVSLTAGEARVVELLVREGLSDGELAGRLNISARTVEEHLRAAYQKAAAHWEMEDVSRAGLIALLNLYYVTEAEGNTGFSA